MLKMWGQMFHICVVKNEQNEISVLTSCNLHLLLLDVHMQAYLWALIHQYIIPYLAY